jgi:two-component system, response regulator PdtaR
VGRHGALNGRFPPCTGATPTRPLADDAGRTACYVPAAVKVLIADDDRLVRTILTDLLGELGHLVVVAENGAEAVTLCAREVPDVLVLDLLMPRLSGLDALHRMRAAGCAAPAILLTAISDGSFREMEGSEAIELRLEKPVTRRALERALARAMGGR